jgi:ribosome-associated protein
LFCDEDSELAKKANIKAKNFAVVAAKVAVERHCTDVVVLDLRGLSPVTDYFVIATGTSSRQIQSVSDEVSQEGRTRDFKRFGRAGYEEGRWVVLDFIDVMVHLFDSEYRQYYDLDLLWGDAKKIEY